MHTDSGAVEPNQAAPAHAILLLEDEPVSAAFLGLALAPLGLDVCQASSLAEARDLLQQRRFSLLVMDLNLPDGTGSELLGELRACRSSPSQDAMAIALTAELDETRRAALRALGFADALAKPITAAALRDVVSRCIAMAARSPLVDHKDKTGAPAVWDLDAALAACGGSQEVLDALRGLFLKELPIQLQKVRHALEAGERQAAHDEMHRLLAGCGFCGASDLALSTRRLMQAVPEGNELKQALSAFEASVSRVLETHPGEQMPGR